MSGGVRTFKLANGGFADVPEESMDEWMRRMDKRGVKFTTADVSANMDVGEPTTIKTTQPAAAQDDDWLTTAGDALWSGAQGVMHGWGDEVAGLRGPEYRQAANDRLDLAQRRSPVASAAAGVIGQGAEDFMLAPARLGGAALGAISGGISGAGEQEENRTAGLLGGGAAGAAFGKAGELVSDVGGGALRWAGGKLGDLGNYVRNAAIGAGSGDLQKLARTRGLDYVEGGLGGAAERLGLTNRFFPQSPSSYARKAQAVAGREGAAEGQALADADQELATHVITDDLAQGLERRGAGARDATPEGVAEQNRLDQMAGLLRSEKGPMLPPSELNAQKSAYYDRGYKQQGISDSEAGLSAEANRMAGSEAREQLLAALDYAPPGVKPRYEAAAQNYGEASMIRDMARDTAASRAATPTDAGLWSTATRPLTRTLQNYGPDAAANVSLLGRDTLNGAGTALDVAGQGLTAAAGGLGANVTDAALGALQNNPQALGPYANQFAEAAGSPEPGAVSALIVQLIQDDPEFRTQILPRLRGGS